MLVKGIVPRGYCKGVVRAIEIAKKQAHQTAPVYILGMIVHNQYIVNALEDLGIQTIDFKGKTRLELLDEINVDIEDVMKMYQENPVVPVKFPGEDNLLRITRGVAYRHAHSLK